MARSTSSELAHLLGAVVTPEQMWRLADVWYHDRADPSWRRKTADEAETIFAAIGLTGDFWRLTA